MGAVVFGAGTVRSRVVVAESDSTARTQLSLAGPVDVLDDHARTPRTVQCAGQSLGSTPPSTPSRALVALLLAAIGIGPLIADFLYRPAAARHIDNPGWPPHAKFHDAQYVVMSPLVSAVGLRVLFQRDGDAHAHLRQAAALASVAWLGLWSALLFPGTAAVDPEFAPTGPKPAGLDPQLRLSLIALGGLAGAVTTEAVRARRSPPGRWSDRGQRPEGVTARMAP